MINTVTTLRIKNKTNNSIDNTTGDWSFVAGESNFYIINNIDNKKYKIDIIEVS
tara:strand:- start:1262 stop:1423 length:162 start_codon:yes stop_codon:yes gene_type:complete